MKLILVVTHSISCLCSGVDLAAFLSQELTGCKNLPLLSKPGLWLQSAVASWLVGLQVTCCCDEAYIWWPVGHPMLLIPMFSPCTVLTIAFHLADLGEGHHGATHLSTGATSFLFFFVLFHLVRNA